MPAKPLVKRIQHEAYRLVFWQITGVIVLALLVWPLLGVVSSFSIFVGGMAYALPNLVFVWCVFRFSGVKQMQQFMAAFFVGEMIKLILSAVLFLLIVKYLPISLLSVLTGFIAAMVSFWAASVRYCLGKSWTGSRLRGNNAN